MTTATAAVFGCTGLVGNQILTTVLDVDQFSSIYTFSRRAPKTGESPKLHATTETDTTKWPSQLASQSPFPNAVFSALGTNRAQAGGIQNQWKIDHDLNVELAKAAKAGGATTFVFISSGGTRGMLSSFVPYSKMKIGVEDAVKELGFEHAIILRPGLLMGAREVEHTGGPLMNTMVKSLGHISQGWQDTFGQDSEVVGRAAVKAAILAAEGKAPSKFWIVENHDIVRMGRDEWKV